MKRLLPYVPTCVWIFFAAIMLFQIISEFYLKVPVIIYPSPGVRLEEVDAKFTWNYVVGIPREKQGFRLEIAHDPRFKRIVKTETISNNHIRIKNTFIENRPYYYRLRLEVGDTTHGWSRIIKIYRKNRKE